MVEVKIDDLVVRVYTFEGYVVVPIRLTEVYKSLKWKMQERYDGYHGMVRRLYNKNDVHCWEDFMKLKKSIEVEGFDNDFPVLVCKRNGVLEVVDGQHRCSILLFLGIETVECLEVKE